MFFWRSIVLQYEDAATPSVAQWKKTIAARELSTLVCLNWLLLCSSLVGNCLKFGCWYSACKSVYWQVFPRIFFIPKKSVPWLLLPVSLFTLNQITAVIYLRGKSKGENLPRSTNQVVRWSKVFLYPRIYNYFNSSDIWMIHIGSISFTSIFYVHHDTPWITRIMKTDVLFGICL